MRRLSSSILGVIAVAVIVIGVNMFSDARFGTFRFDLTHGGIHTLSDGTRKVLDGLKEPVTLRFFYSRRLGATIPSYGTFADHIRDALEEYRAASGGKVKVEYFDPEPFSDTEDRAVAYGLQAVPVDNAGNQVWFGLAGFNLEDDERTIPFFQAEREPFLEFDLTKLIYELSNPKRVIVGIMTPLPVEGDPRAMMMGNPRAPAAQPWASVVLLRQTNDLKSIQTDTDKIDADVSVLMVASPRNLSAQTLYAIDQFVMRGGKLMVLVDPWSEALATVPSPNGMPPTDTSSDLKQLFDAWGIEYDPTKVTGDLTGAWRVRGSAQDPSAQQAVNYVAWFNVRDGINHDDPATADLQQITLAAPGAIGKKSGAAIEFTPLVSSSPKSGNIPRDQLAVPDPRKILAGFKIEGGPRVLAARVRGKLTSAFTGPPALPDGKQRPADFPAHKAETDGPANLVIIADTDLLADRFWVRVADFFGQQTATPFSDNGPFIANLIGSLAGGDALIGLRARGASSHPFTVVDDMQAGAEARYRRTEQALKAHLDEVQKQLRGLRSGGDPTEGRATEAVITPEQRMAIDAARDDILDTRKKLRDVQLELNREISALKTKLLVVNIALVPAIMTLIAIAMAFGRRVHRARGRAAS